MAAYSTLVAFEQLLNQLLNSDLLPTEELFSLRRKTSSLKSSLEKIFPAPKNYRDEANKLADRIRKKFFEAQDTIEDFIFYTQNHSPESPETSKSQSLTSISWQEIIANIDPIIEEAEKLGYSITRSKKFTEPVAESRSLSTKIVGQENYKAWLEKKLMAAIDSSLVIPISGMVGVGKTTLARSVYEDPTIKDKFPYRAWVTVDQGHSVADILAKILSSLKSRGQKAGDKVYESDEAKLGVELHQALAKNRYLVVIDDLWYAETWMRVKTALPDNENSSRILVTTRIWSMARAVDSSCGLQMEPMNEEDSWTLLCNRTFGDDKDCPANLENIGRVIVKHCMGLPLSLIVIGGILSQGSRDADYWQTVKEDTYAAGSKVRPGDAYIGILSLSYDYLPPNLQGCYLYMGAFPEDSDIPVSKLIRLWVAEGFLTTTTSQLIEKVAEQSLRNLIERNLVLIRKNGSDGRIKYCGMNDRLRALAERKSEGDRFFHSIKKHPQKLEQGTDTQRRISVHKNILMCLEEIYNSTKKITNAHSLLFVGPHHHHPMPFNLTFDSLKVLDAFSFFFIEFPDEVLKLIYLRYLSLTYNGKLPSKIANLQKLQVLIVKRQPKVIYVGAPFLPDKIWSMKELRHLIITETDMPFLSPTEPGTILLENLQTLSNVNADSCTQEVLEHTPNLKKLGMWMEGLKKAEFYMNKLDQLEIFKFTILNPTLKPTADIKPKFFFPNTLRKLNLSGTGLPWEEMEAIAALPNLEVLKLKELAFHGAEWCPDYDFKKLKFLLIEYLNLQNWETESSHFPLLEQLHLRHCYALEVLPSDIVEVENLRLIEMVDCSREAVKWAEEVQATVEGFEVRIIS